MTWRGEYWLLLFQAVWAYFVFPNHLIPVPSATTAWLSILMPVPYFLILLMARPRRVFWLGGLSGVAMIIPPVSFLISFHDSLAVGWLLFLLCAAMVFILVGSFSALSRRALTGFPQAFVLISPLFLESSQFLRLKFSAEFWLLPPPVSLPVYPLAGFPPLIQAASIVGIPGVEFTLFFLAALTAWFLHYHLFPRSHHPWLVVWGAGPENTNVFGSKKNLFIAAVLGTGLSLTSGVGFWDAARVLRAQTEPRQTLKAALIQSQYDPSMIVNWSAAQHPALQLYRRLALEAAARGAEVLIFSENAFPASLPYDLKFWQQFRDIVQEVKIPAMPGFVTKQENLDRSINAWYWLDGQGRIQDIYIKRYLNPLGEYIPWRPLWESLLARPLRTLTAKPFSLVKLTAIGDDTSDLLPGTRETIFDLGGKKIFLKVCDEILIPRYFGEGVRQGGQAIFSPATANWFRHPMFYQHYQLITRFRAVETRRWLGRTVSMAGAFFVDAVGRTVSSSPFGTAAVHVYPVPLLTGLSIYARVGDVFGWSCLMLSFLLLAVAVWRCPRAVV